MSYYPLYYQIDSGLNLAKAPIIMGSASGAIASFPDGAADLPVQSLKVAINPVQDLHGYDYPWPAGGGVNKLKPNLTGYNLTSWLEYDETTEKYTIKQGTGVLPVPIPLDYTIPANTEITVTIFVESGQKAGTIVVGGYHTGDPGTSWEGSVELPSNTNLAGKTYTRTVTTVNELNSFEIFIYGSPTITTDIVFRAQIELGNTSSSWHPYSNICPISGRTGANVTRTGKNIFGGEEFADTILSKVPSAVKDTVAKTIKYTAANIEGKVIFDRFKPNTRYTLLITQASGSNNRNLRIYYTDGSFTSVGYLTTTDANKTIKGLIGVYSTGTSILLYEKFGIFEGVLTAYDFESYQGKNIPITFPSEAGTVYGGHLTLNDDGTGELVVDSAMIESYDGETLPGEWISDRDVYEAGSTPTTGAQVVYKLATPTTYTLTVPQIRTFLGINNIWADTGNTEANYRADTKLYIEQLTKPSEDDMTANANIASGKFFMVGNTLYLSTSAIEQGGAIVPGTNCTELSLADALNTLNT